MTTERQEAAVKDDLKKCFIKVADVEMDECGSSPVSAAQNQSQQRQQKNPEHCHAAAGKICALYIIV